MKGRRYTNYSIDNGQSGANSSSMAYLSGENIEMCKEKCILFFMIYFSFTLVWYIDINQTLYADNTIIIICM